MPAILFDLDGVLYEGDKAIAGAAEAASWFIENSIPHLFLTNTTSKSRLALVEKLAAFNIPAGVDNFLTPPVAAIQWLHTQQIKDIAVFVPATTREEFAGFNLFDNENDRVDAVIVGDLGTQWDFQIMNTVFRLLINNPQATLIALGMTRYWRAENGLQLDVGPMIKAFEYASDRKALVTGKPALAFYRSAVSLLGAEKNIVMIGDDIRGDIEAAQNAGMTAILVRSGKFSETDLELGIKPDTVLDSVADLPAWWQQNFGHI